MDVHQACKVLTHSQIENTLMLFVILVQLLTVYN